MCDLVVVVVVVAVLRFFCMLLWLTRDCSFVLTLLMFCSYGVDVYIERVEDVLVHQQLLADAKDPEKRPAFHVRFVEVFAYYVCVGVQTAKFEVSTLIVLR